MPDGSKINLTFLDFDVEGGFDYSYNYDDYYEDYYDDYYDYDDDCPFDFMEISYGNVTNKKYCGNLTSSLPGPFITCDNIKVKFSSDDTFLDDTFQSENFPGFRAVWSLLEDVGNIF